SQAEAVAMERLRPDRLAVEERDEVQVPALRCPGLERALVELEEPIQVEVVRPGAAEGHLLGRVDAGLRDAEERDQLVACRQAQLQPGRTQAERPQRLDVHRLASFRTIASTPQTSAMITAS